MITLILLLLTITVAAILLAGLAGIVTIAWPILLILGIGFVFDLIIFKLIFKKKK